MSFFVKVLEKENLSDCYYLEEDDICVYLGDYTPRGGYDCSDVNQLIANLKKSIDRREMDDYRYKLSAIDQCASMIKCVLDHILKQTTASIIIIPIPPSKSKDHELYDNRMINIATKASQDQDRVKVIEFVEQITSTEAMHLSASRLSPLQLQNNYDVLSEIPDTDNVEVVLIFDDVLTTGSHFKAVKNMILNQYPNLSGKIYGLFIAKVVRT